MWKSFVASFYQQIKVTITYFIFFIHALMCVIRQFYIFIISHSVFCSTIYMFLNTCLWLFFCCCCCSYCSSFLTLCMTIVLQYIAVKRWGKKIYVNDKNHNHKQIKFSITFFLLSCDTHVLCNLLFNTSVNILLMKLVHIFKI